MCTNLTRGLAICLALFAVGPLNASPGFEDLVNRVRAGAGDADITAFIAGSPVAYDLTVDEILFLNDLGVSAELIKAAVEHGKQLSAAAPSGTALPVAPPAPVAAVTPGSVVASPPAAMVVMEPLAAAPVVAVAPPAQSDVSYFYQTLAPYGCWLNLDDGWYWQPTVVVVNREWRPYCERGHWVFTDCGWMWQSDYSWGWAPFHYGRWRQHARYGWVWMPDTVWGPAWVVWRSDSAAVGWAPLPPGAVFESGGGFMFRGRRAHAGFDFELNADAFTFVEPARFCEPALARHRWPRAEVTRVFNATTIIQNSYVVTDNRIVNHGPPVVRIAGATQREILPLRIMDQPSPSGHPLRPGQNAGGPTLSVFRPHLESTARETPEAVATRLRAQSYDRRRDESRGSGAAAVRPSAGALRPVLPERANGAGGRQIIDQGGSMRGPSGGSVARPPGPLQPRPAVAAELNHGAMRQQADAARQMEIQRRSQDLQRQQDAQRRILQLQRQAEETDARQQELQRRDQPAAQPDVQRRGNDSAAVREQRVQRPPALPNVFQDYGNGQLTGAASARGASSRETANRNEPGRGN